MYNTETTYKESDEKNMKHSELKGNFILLLTALIWGCAFVAQSVGMDHVGPYTFQCTRSFIGSAVLIPVFLLTDHSKKKNGTYVPPTETQRKTQLIAGILCGIIMTIAANLQQIGIQYTTAGKAGFITAIYLLIVPILGLFMKKKVAPKIWFCVVLALIGLYMLSVNESISAINKGDIFVLLCAFAFAFHIIAVDYYVDRVDGVRLSHTQFLVCGILSGILMFIYETPTWEGISNAAIPILYAGIMSCGIAYTLQIIGQKYTNPTMASMIMSLESVFAVLGGMVLLHEIPTAKEAIGCLLMFIAIIIPQLPERSSKKKSRVF